jgi:glutamyl-tRNA reductase
MTIVNVGVSYRTAPAGVLEKLAVPAEERSGVLARLHALSAVDEVFVLSTCNRAEVYAATRQPAAETGRALAGVLADRAPMPVSDLLRAARIHFGGAAAEHLFSVTCGLDSMAIGEEQIVAQVKTAHRDAAAAGTTGPVLTGLIEAALRASKRARTQTTIGTTGVSLARAGLGLAQAHLGGELAGRHAVVAGTGSIGKLAAQLLRQAGAGQLSITSRSQARAAELAAAVGGRPLPASGLPAAIAAADILVTASGASAPLVRASDVRAARRPHGHRALFVLDLGMPPDVEPGVGELPGVALVNIAALSRHLAAAAHTPDQLPQARAIVSAEAAAYLTQQEQAAAAPTIAALHAQIRQLADTELARLHHRLPGLTDEQRAETAATVHRILRKVLHRPTARAKELSTGPHGPAYLEALRQLFDLPTAPAPEHSAPRAGLSATAKRS